MKGSIALRQPVQTIRVNTASSNITTSAYLEILSAANNLYAGSAIEVFNPSGSILKLATGGAGSEVDLPYTILPGGSMIVAQVPRGTRLSVRAIDANVTTGYFVVNLMG